MSSRLEDIDKFGAEVQVEDQNQIVENHEPVNGSVNVAQTNPNSRVNGKWGPFGFKRDASNYTLTQNLFHQAQNQSSVPSSLTQTKRMKTGEEPSKMS